MHTHQIAMCRWQRACSLDPSNTHGKPSLLSGHALNPSRTGWPGHPREDTQRGHPASYRVLSPPQERGRWKEPRWQLTVANRMLQRARAGSRGARVQARSPLVHPREDFHPRYQALPPALACGQEGKRRRIAAVRAGSEGHRAGTCSLHPNATERDRAPSREGWKRREGTRPA